MVKNASLIRQVNIKGDAKLCVKWKLITSAELINTGFMAAMPKLVGSSDTEAVKTLKVRRYQSKAKDREATNQ